MARAETVPQAAAPPRPLHVMVKPIGPICNLDCSYCFYLHKTGLYPEERQWRIPPQVLERFIQAYIAASPGPHVPFAWQGGEPTLMGLPFFQQVVALQRRYLPPGWTCSNALQTNGTLLDDDWGQFLAREQFLVGISLDGPAPLHDAYRQDKRGGPTHAAVMRGLRLLQSHGVEFNVLCVVQAANVAHPLEVYDFFVSEGVRWIQFIPLVERDPQRSGGLSERSVPPESYGRFLAAIFDRWVRRDVGRIFIQHFEECLAVWAGLPASLCVLQETCGRALVMEHNGDLYACDHFVLPSHRRGNVLIDDLRAMADAPEQDRFGDAKRDTLPACCRRCPVRFICQGGCPKDRLARSPEGEPGLNVLCPGYRFFYTHIGPAMERMAALWRQGLPPARIMDELREADARRWRHVGRNDPCPCGSGRKFKHCCLGQISPPGASAGRADPAQS